MAIVAGVDPIDVPSTTVSHLSKEIGKLLDDLLTKTKPTKFMSDSIYAKTTMDKLKKVRMVALPGQRTSAGERITEGNIQCDKKVRTDYPIGTVFLVKGLRSNGSFYTCNTVSPLVRTKAADSDHPIATPQEVDEYELWSSVVVDDPKDTGDMVVEDTKKRKTLFDTLSKIAPPTIEDDGFLVPIEIWQLLLRNTKKCQNTLLIGPTGTGKTEVFELVKQRMGVAFAKPFDMGSMQDPVSGLLGVHRLSAKGESIFDYSRFSKEIQVEGNHILLDEISRAPSAANNILFPCLDSRRELPIEIACGDTSRNIEIAKGVCFFATANVGYEYTGTHTLDKALIDRFMPVEIGYLPQADEAKVISARTYIPIVQANIIAAILKTIRSLHAKGELSTTVSIRQGLQIGQLIKDGFKQITAFKLVLLPLFDGTESEGERSTVAKILMGK